MEMPIDLFLEIASWSYPLTLIQLARISKGLRDMLLSKQARLMWHAALCSIPDLPSCPSDLIEPQYAALLFVRVCMVNDCLVMLKFDEPERRNMTIDDLNRLVKTGQLVCMCGNPRLPAPEKWSWAGLVRHVHDEQQWHTDMLLYRKSRVESKHILHNDHDLAGPPFLRLSLNKEPNDPYQRTEHASYLAQTSHITTEDTSSPKTTYRICFAMVKVALRWRCFNELHHSEAFITYHMRAKHCQEYDPKSGLVEM